MLTSAVEGLALVRGDSHFSMLSLALALALALGVLLWVVLFMFVRGLRKRSLVHSAPR